MGSLNEHKSFHRIKNRFYLSHELIRKSRLITTCILLLIGFHSALAQNSIDQKIENYLKRIESLVGEEIDNPKVFLNRDLLLKEKSEVEGIDKINVCLDLYTYFIYRSKERAKYHNNEALKLSNDLSYTEGTLRALHNQAYIMFVEGEFEKTLDLIKKAQADYKLSAFPNIEADFLTLNSYVHSERGEYDTALEICLILLKRGESDNQDYVLMRAYSAISHFYLRLGDNEKAFNYCLKGLNIIIKLKKGQYLFPKIDEIARMTHKQLGNKKALEIYQFYLDLEKKISGPGDYIQSVVFMNIADIYIEEKKFVEAEGLLIKALKLIDSNGYRFRKPRAHELMAKLHLEKRDTVKALASYEKGVEAAQEINAFAVLKNTSAALANLYKSLQDTVKATKFSSLYNVVSDSLFSTETNQRVMILGAQLKILEISHQKENLELQNHSQEERYRFIVVVLILALMLAGITGYMYLKINKKNKLLFSRTKELAVTQLNALNNENYKVKELDQSDVQDKGKCNKKGNIGEDIKQIILAKLNRFEIEEFYLDANCNLHQLSEKLQTNQKYLSQVINQEKNSNFNNYINKLRINHLLQRLLEDKEFRGSKLAYISATSGFNNLNTFNTAFKKRLGILPSYFIKELNEAENKEHFLAGIQNSN
jgi:AraC-like DNA-binding protein